MDLTTVILTGGFTMASFIKCHWLLLHEPQCLSLETEGYRRSLSLHCQSEEYGRAQQIKVL